MKRNNIPEEIPPINFTGGIRGKHRIACQNGYQIHVEQADGSVIIHKFLPDKSAIILDDDIKQYFPDAPAVNAALRGLINLVPQRRKRVRTA